MYCRSIDPRQKMERLFQPLLQFLQNSETAGEEAVLQESFSDRSTELKLSVRNTPRVLNGLHVISCLEPTFENNLILSLKRGI